jgi:Fe-S cluster biogenesis protein NfuA
MTAQTQDQQVTKEEMLRSLLEQISSYIEQYHGGSAEMVAFDGKEVKVKLGGACVGCPLAEATRCHSCRGRVRATTRINKSLSKEDFHHV